MKVFLTYFAIFGILSSYLAFAKTYDFFNPDKKLGQMKELEHRGLKVYFYTPLYNSGVDNVVVGTQGIWRAKKGQNLTKVVGFYRCMGFGLSHVSYYTDEGEDKELLLGYNHEDEYLVEIDKKKFYEKLVGYTVKNADFNNNIPGHQVFYELEKYLKERDEAELKEAAKAAAKVDEKAPLDKEAHVEL